MCSFYIHFLRSIFIMKGCFILSNAVSAVLPRFLLLILYVVDVIECLCDWSVYVEALWYSWNKSHFGFSFLRGYLLLVSSHYWLFCHSGFLCLCACILVNCKHAKIHPFPLDFQTCGCLVASVSVWVAYYHFFFLWFQLWRFLLHLWFY